MAKIKNNLITILPICSFLICSFYLLSSNSKHILFKTLSVSFFLTAFLIMLTISLKRRARLIEIKIEDLQEKINLSEEDLKKENNLESSLKKKIIRYKELENITEKLSSTLSLDNATNILIDSAFDLVGRNSGNCILYLVSAQDARLRLFTCRKDKDMVLKAKEGDVFDRWVARNTSSLLVEDANNDFRFDLEKITEDERREIGSIASTPMFRFDKFLGILRLDFEKKFYYNLDDLRFLSILADLGTIAIENCLIYSHMQDLAIKDDLTGLYLRRYIMQRFDEEFEKCKSRMSPLTVLMIDVDHFKTFNDKFGHIAGDIVLKNISFWLKDAFDQKQGIIGRYGGEEFIVILPNFNKKDAFSIAQDLRERVYNTRLALRRNELETSISIGLAVFPEDAKDKEGLLRNADSALYKAKRLGRNRVCHF